MQHFHRDQFDNPENARLRKGKRKEREGEYGNAGLEAGRLALF